MSASTLDQFPPELALEIITHLSSPDDLLAFISTAKYFYDLFQSRSRYVLASVIRNGLGDTNLRIAVATCQAAEISKAWVREPSVQKSAQLQREFFQANPSGASSHLECLDDIRLIMPLYRLWNASNHFIPEFSLCAGQRLQVRSYIHQWDSTPEFSGPSQTEHDRIQRAFFLHTMYRRCIPGRFDSEVEMRHDLRPQQLEFMEQFPPWEREQIVSVDEFLYEHAAKMVKKSIRFKVNQISDFYTSQYCLDPTTICMMGCLNEKSRVFTCWCLKLERHAFPYDTICGKLAAHGILFLRWLESLDPRARLFVIERLQDHHDISPVSSAISSPLSTILALASHDRQTNWSVKISPCRQVRFGWDLARVYDVPILPIRPSPETFALRSAGYVFWDQATLEAHTDLAEVPFWSDGMPSHESDYYAWADQLTENIAEEVALVQIPTQTSRADMQSITNSLRPKEEWVEKYHHVFVNEQSKSRFPLIFSEKAEKTFNIEG